MKAVATDIIWDKIENSYKYGVTIAYFSKHQNFPYLNARYADQWSEYQPVIVLNAEVDQNTYP